MVVGNGFRQDVGNAVGSWTITSTDFNVGSGGADVVFDFDYLNAFSNELTDLTPEGAPNTNLSQARYRFDITINQVNAAGDLVNPIYSYSSAPTDRLQSSIVPVNIAPFGFTDTPLADNNPRVVNFPLNTVLLTTNLAELTNTDSYRITISSEQIVDTRVLTPPEIPEPRTFVSLVGLGFLGIVKKTN